MLCGCCDLLGYVRSEEIGDPRRERGLVGVDVASVVVCVVLSLSGG